MEAIGGELELIVRLPGRAPLRIDRLGDIGVARGVAVGTVKGGVRLGAGLSGGFRG